MTKVTKQTGHIKNGSVRKCDFCRKKCLENKEEIQWEHWCDLGAIRTRAKRRIFPASGHTLLSLSLSLPLIVSHTDCRHRASYQLDNQLPRRAQIKRK